MEATEADPRGYQLTGQRYGKAGIRLVHVDRDGPADQLVERTVATALTGALAETYLSGDNAAVLPTDTQKNTVYALARDHGLLPVEEFALRLADHFATDQPTAPLLSRATVEIDQHRWERIGPRPHSFTRQTSWTRTVRASRQGALASVEAGLRDLVLLNTTGSEFAGFPRDRYTTLAETSDRMLATAVDAVWTYSRPTDWDAAFELVHAALVAAFADTYSQSLQQTLYAMATSVLDAVPEVARVQLRLPNRHHFRTDLAPFGLDNPGEVYLATDRPYGLIEGTVSRADAAMTFGWRPAPEGRDDR